MVQMPEAALEAYIAQFKDLFPDLRLYKRFRQLNYGLLAAGSPKISRVVATLPQNTKRPFHQAKAFYRLLANERVSPEALLERVSQVSLAGLKGEEVYVLWDLRPIKKPYARRMEGLSRVTRQRVPGYELLTGLALDGEGGLGLAYTHLLAYGEKTLRSLPQEMLKGLEVAARRLKALGKRPLFVLERRFDDRKVFAQLARLGLPFVARVYHNRLLGDQSLQGLAQGLALPFQAKCPLRVGGEVRPVGVRLGFAPLALLEGGLTLVVAWVPDLEERWWLLTNLPVRREEEAWRAVEAYAKRSYKEAFFRLLREGLGLEGFQVGRLPAIRKLTGAALGLGLFLWAWEELLEPLPQAQPKPLWDYPLPRPAPVAQWAYG